MAVNGSQVQFKDVRNISHVFANVSHGMQIILLSKVDLKSYHFMIYDGPKVGALSPGNIGSWDGVVNPNLAPDKRKAKNKKLADKLSYGYAQISVKDLAELVSYHGHISDFHRSGWADKTVEITSKPSHPFKKVVQSTGVDAMAISLEENEAVTDVVDNHGQQDAFSDDDDTDTDTDPGTTTGDDASA